MLMPQAKKLIGFVFWQFLPTAWSLACFLNIPLTMLDRISFWQLLPVAWNLAWQIFRLQATCHRQNFGSFNSGGSKEHHLASFWSFNLPQNYQNLKNFHQLQQSRKVLNSWRTCLHFWTTIHNVINWPDQI
jgi:hypothetical protein